MTDNQADTLSVSWGTPEITVDPNLIDALDQIFKEAAAQGMSLFASSGDAGAYDINDVRYPYRYPRTTKTLSVDSPASSPYITAVGGITLAGTQAHPYASVTVPRDRAWAWDYLENYFDTYYGADGGYVRMAFPVGGGGGVSVIEKMPAYQARTPGVQTSAPNQSVIYYPNYPDLTGAMDLDDLPAGFAGRNVPDVALNADPYTGYAVYFGGTMYSGNGGTSFCRAANERHCRATRRGCSRTFGVPESNLVPHGPAHGARLAGGAVHRHHRG